MACVENGTLYSYVLGYFCHDYDACHKYCGSRACFSSTNSLFEFREFFCRIAVTEFPIPPKKSVIFFQLDLFIIISLQLNPLMINSKNKLGEVSGLIFLDKKVIALF